MDLETLILYDHWANQKIFNALQLVESDEIKSEIETMFSHIVAAQVVWLSRMMGERSEMKIWPELSVSEIDKFIRENPAKLKSLIPRKEESISYKNSKGISHQSKAGDILMHLVIHGQHHRAQIAKMLREAEITPPGTDFIFFTREINN
ncbi:MAG: DinB family protein [Gracilimonas sp.]|nr:DinB family protein [Gracilimonas sp.]